MAVFRIEKTKDYTVMANHHLRNTELSLKAKGLLSLMLSLPENWDYTTKGLAYICKDGVDSISSTIKELEEHGYILRKRIRNGKGQLTTVEYTILEEPRNVRNKPIEPKRENPVLDNPILEKPILENPDQLNTKESNTDILSIDISNPILSKSEEPQAVDWNGKEIRESYRELILENISYDILIQDKAGDRERINEIVELILDTVCSERQKFCISGDDFPIDVVKSRLLKLNNQHIQYVLDCMDNNTTYIHNIKKYLLAVLFNAPSTIGNYYSSLVNHDMYGNGTSG